MFRNDVGTEAVGLFLAVVGVIAAFVILPAAWYISAPMAIFAGYVVLETVLPEVWDDPDYDE